MGEVFDLGVWNKAVREASCGVVSPALLPAERRKWERELAKLTTPEKCLAASAAIEVLLRMQESAQCAPQCSVAVSQNVGRNACDARNCAG